MNNKAFDLHAGEPGNIPSGRHWRRICGLVALSALVVLIFLPQMFMKGNALTNLPLEAATATPQATQTQAISVTYQVKPTKDKNDIVYGTLVGQTDTTVTVITQPAHRLTVARHDVAKQTCDALQPSGDCPVGQPVAVSLGSIDGFLIMEDAGTFTIQTPSNKVRILKHATAHNADGSLNQERTPADCQADPAQGCSIKLVLNADDPNNQVSGTLLNATPDQLVVEVEPEQRVTINKSDIVKVIGGPPLAGVVEAADAHAHDDFDATDLSGALGGTGVPITTQNIQQLKPLVKAPSRLPNTIIQQIIWQRAREIEIVVHPTTIWIYRPDTLGPHLRRIGWSSPLGELSLSPDGKSIANAGLDSNTYGPKITVWDVTSGERISFLPGAVRVEFSPDGQDMAGSQGKGIGFWNVTTGKVDRTINDAGFATKSAQVPPIRFSPDGKLIAALNADGTVGLWDTSNGKLVRLVSQQAGGVSNLRFGPDGKLLAGRIDKRIQLWDVATGDSKALLEGHTGNVVEMNFSPDSTILASAGVDKTVRLWDTSSGKLITTLTMDADAPIFSVVFSPDGTRLATGGNALWFWGVPKP